jgi:phosphotransferase system enzyme I (PtsP)
MAIGIDRLSMAASSIGQIKELVLSLDLQAIRGQICAALDEGGDPLVIRDLIYDLADRQHLPL